ncbi:histidine kinase [Nonomuraea sp. 3-1Str]|uniref:sensor histidine kinase n=1 Tax=Nonomuraea sp. 3-1Str TaxID=2929801 RepID=UPI00285E2F2A|nr:histidine kinase [Nonomuraea sp. 3-1Str]MDR8410518.1 histidine kinase [Nonomuraea sp. 3-1Str]
MHEPNPLFARRLSRGQLVMLDLLAGVCFSLLFLTAPPPVFDVPWWGWLSVSFGLGLPLALRRVWPVPVFCLVLAVSVAAVVLGLVSIAYVAPAYALYIVALTDDRGAPAPTMAIAVLTLITLVGLVAMGGAPHPSGPLWATRLDVPLLGIAALGGSWTVGRAVRERRIYAARDAERLAEQKVTEERLRIARELHDVVTHSVGLIAVKAGVANHVMRTKPEEAHDALRVIETVSRSAMVEMRHLLGILRSNDDVDMGPLPGLAGIRGLAERARLAGVEVELDMRITPSQESDVPSGRGPWGSTVEHPAPGGVHPASGGRDPAPGEGRPASRLVHVEEDPVHAGAEESRASAEEKRPDRGRKDAAEVPGGPRVRGSAPDGRQEAWEEAGRRGRGSVERWLPEGVELSAYRIVQEALTNVAKHSGPARCWVSVVADSSKVRIEVTNDGAAGRGPTGSRPGGWGLVRGEVAMEGAGHGLIGMRERVMMFGGAFEAGALPGGGFRVLATLPYGSAA